MQGCMATGMRFCLKSPAVGSMKRQRPDEDLREMEEKAKTAVVSLGFDSAAREGTRVPPARETGTGVVGFAVRMVELGDAVIVAAEAMNVLDTKIVSGIVDEASVVSRIILDTDCAAMVEALLRGRVTVTKHVEVHPGDEVVELASA